MSCFSGLWNCFWGQDRVRSDPEVIDWKCDLRGEVEVKLKLYALLWLPNCVLEPLGYGGYHAEVEVGGRAYYYECYEGTGLWSRAVSRHRKPTHTFVYKTRLRRGEFGKILVGLNLEWRGDDYCILRRNCIDFSAAFCQELGVGPFPSWAFTLPKALVEAAEAWKQRYGRDLIGPDPNARARRRRRWTPPTFEKAD